MKPPRMTATLLAAFVFAGVIALCAPHQLPVTLYKLSLVTLAAVVGYWIDREIFPYARPDRFDPVAGLGYEFAFSMLRRAIIVAACILGVGLGA